MALWSLPHPTRIASCYSWTLLSSKLWFKGYCVHGEATHEKPSFTLVNALPLRIMWLIFMFHAMVLSLFCISQRNISRLISLRQRQWRSMFPGCCWQPCCGLNNYRNLRKPCATFTIWYLNEPILVTSLPWFRCSILHVLMFVKVVPLLAPALKAAQFSPFGPCTWLTGQGSQMHKIPIDLGTSALAGSLWYQCWPFRQAYLFKACFVVRSSFFWFLQKAHIKLHSRLTRETSAQSSETTASSCNR